MRGFDLQEVIEDNLEDMQVYADFLGAEEFDKTKENYERALELMEQMFEVELERLKMSQPIDHEALKASYGEEIVERYSHVFDSYLKGG